MIPWKFTYTHMLITFDTFEMLSVNVPSPVALEQAALVVRMSPRVYSVRLYQPGTHELAESWECYPKPRTRRGRVLARVVAR